MPITFLGICETVIFAVAFGLKSGTVAGGFNAAAWTFTAYMVFKLAFYIPRMIPSQVIFRAPKLQDVTPQIDRDNLPRIAYPRIRTTYGEEAVDALVRVILLKVGNAADESSIHAFVAAKFQTMRRQVSERYGGIIGEINTLAFEGAIGTILGMMTFLAQAVVLFVLPDFNPDDTDSTEFVAAIARNLESINLYTVMTAFITSLIGWGGKGWLGKYIEDRRDAEAQSLTGVEAWIQDEIIARLHLPSQVTTYLTLSATSELAQPLVRAMERIGELTDDLYAATKSHAELADKVGRVLAPRLKEVANGLASLDGAAVSLELVRGGYKLTINRRGSEGGENE